MTAPDKIYIYREPPKDYFEDGWGESKVDDMESIPYIRKDSLLEWAKEHKVELLDSAKTMDTDSVGKCINAGALTMLDNVIDKINSL